MSDSESILGSLTGSIEKEFSVGGCGLSLWVEGGVRGLNGRFGEVNRVELGGGGRLSCAAGGRVFVSKSKEECVGCLIVESRE